MTIVLGIADLEHGAGRGADGRRAGLALYGLVPAQRSLEDVFVSLVEGARGERMHALTIARFTIHEAISRRLVLAAAVLSLVFLALYALGFSLALQHAPRDSGPARRPQRGRLPPARS